MGDFAIEAGIARRGAKHGSPSVSWDGREVGDLAVGRRALHYANMMAEHDSAELTRFLKAGLLTKSFEPLGIS